MVDSGRVVHKPVNSFLFVTGRAVLAVRNYTKSKKSERQRLFNSEIFIKRISFQVYFFVFFNYPVKLMHMID